VRSLWVYAYVIVPPQPSGRLGAIRALLRGGGAAARNEQRTWSGRLVLERHATHILIVSDAIERDQPVSERLEEELARLEAGFTVTEPLAVTDQVAGDKWVANYSGNGHGH